MAYKKFTTVLSQTSCTYFVCIDAIFIFIGFASGGFPNNHFL